MPSHRSHRRKDEKEPLTWGPMKFKWIERNISPGKLYLIFYYCKCLLHVGIVPGFDMVKYLQKQGWLPIARKCPACQNAMSLIRNRSFSDGCLWRCNGKVRKPHKKTTTSGKAVSVRNLTWFDSSHLSMLEIIDLAYNWWLR